MTSNPSPCLGSLSLCWCSLPDHSSLSKCGAGMYQLVGSSTCIRHGSCWPMPFSSWASVSLEFSFSKNQTEGSGRRWGPCALSIDIEFGFRGWRSPSLGLTSWSSKPLVYDRLWVLLRLKGISVCEAAKGLGRLGGTSQSEDEGTPGPFVGMLRRWAARARPAQ